MPLPVISFHLGAEHGFLEERPSEVSLRSTEVNESPDPNQRTMHEHESSARSKGAGIGGWGKQSDLLVRLSASSSVTWPPKTTFLIASDGCVQGPSGSIQSGRPRRRCSDSWGEREREEEEDNEDGECYLAGAARRRGRGGGGPLALGLRPREQKGAPWLEI